MRCRHSQRKYSAIISEIIDMNNYWHLWYDITIADGSDHINPSQARTIKIAIGIESTPFLFIVFFFHFPRILYKKSRVFIATHFCSAHFISHIWYQHIIKWENIHAKHMQFCFLSIYYLTTLRSISEYCDCFFCVQLSSTQFAICFNMILCVCVFVLCMYFAVARVPSHSQAI